MEIQQDENFGKFHYNRGKIYKLCCKDPNITDIYIGSTLNHYRRKNIHKHYCNNPSSRNYNIPLYQFIRANGGFDNWDIIVLEEYAAENKNDLLWKEREWIENLKPSLNSYYKPIASVDELKEYRKQYKKQYNENNRERLREHDKKYRENTREQRKEYYQNNKEHILEKSKEYHQKNKERISKKDKEYYEANKKKILEQKKKYSSEKVECEICKVSIRRDSMSKHKRSQKHKNNLEKNSTEP